ncbi:MAG: PQQ-binding-like beta-propeller repeat protein [Proteobacteria bacterium]|nr:PQQ-binding-like beta-propeller repeat protein [Pseudomonadota bacterium]
MNVYMSLYNKTFCKDYAIKYLRYLCLVLVVFMVSSPSFAGPTEQRCGPFLTTHLKQVPFCPLYRLYAHRFIKTSRHNTKPSLAYDPVGISGWKGQEIYYLGEDKSTLLRSSVESGAILVRYKVGAKLTVPALVDNKHVYVASVEGKVFQFDRLSGKQQWRVDLSSPVASEMIYAAGSLYFKTYLGQVFKVDTTQGAIQWVSTLREKTDVDSMNMRQQRPLLLTSSTLWVGGIHTVEGFGRSNGDSLGSLRTFQSTTQGINAVIGIVQQPSMVFARFDGHVFAYNPPNTYQSIAELNPIWNYTADSYISSMVAVNHHFYVGTLKGEVIQITHPTTATHPSSANQARYQKTAPKIASRFLADAAISSISALRVHGSPALLISTVNGDIIGLSQDLSKVLFHKRSLLSLHAPPLVISSPLRHLAYFVSGYGHIYSYHLPGKVKTPSVTSLFSMLFEK